MSTELSHGHGTTGPAVRGLVHAAHAGPALAVTVLSGLLAAAQDLDPGTTVLVVVAVLAGQLSVGWSNDLVDVGRDRRAGRADKPLATGEASLAVVRAKLAQMIARTESVQSWLENLTCQMCNMVGVRRCLSSLGLLTPLFY